MQRCILQAFFFLFHFYNLDHIGGKVQVNRCTAGTNDYIARSDKTSFFQDFNLIKENIIQTFFFIIKESPYAPAKAQLINKGLFFCENIKE